MFINAKVSCSCKKLIITWKEVQKVDPTLHYQRHCHKVANYTCEILIFVDNEIYGPSFHGYFGGFSCDSN